ncbi:MAG: hypothetical protein AMS24_03910 [Chlamydiae bacterium SM23_39]|nr:MAG: hypothetical protein AMS24_03910 [Chlamydiae bacterium SM23_39]
MKNNYVLKTFFIFCFSFLLVYSGFYATKLLKNEKNIIRAEIAVFDDLTDPNGKIIEVKLDDVNLILKPADPSGSRGSSFFQLFPGKHVLKWTVQNNKYKWPRYTKYKKEIKLKKTDQWIHIRIEGRNLIIS